MVICTVVENSLCNGIMETEEVKNEMDMEMEMETVKVVNVCADTISRNFLLERSRVVRSCFDASVLILPLSIHIRDYIYLVSNIYALIKAYNCGVK